MGVGKQTRKQRSSELRTKVMKHMLSEALEPYHKRTVSLAALFYNNDTHQHRCPKNYR